MRLEPIEAGDVGEILALETRVWGREGASAAQIDARRLACPEGSVAVRDTAGQIVGYAAAQRVRQISDGTWTAQTGGGAIAATHVPDGPIAYGVNMSVLPHAADMGASAAIIRHYACVFVRDGGCSMMCLGSRLPGYARWQAKGGGSIRDYLAARSHGRSIDPELRLYERAGFRVLWPLPGYFPDTRSRDWGAMIGLDRAGALALLAADAEPGARSAA